MRDNNLMQLALGLGSPWRVKACTFDAEARRLDIEIDFARGGRFPCPACARRLPGARRLHAEVARLLPARGVPACAHAPHHLSRLRRQADQRDFAAWIGLVPRPDSTGGKVRLGPISKQADRYLRRLLISGDMAVIRHAHTRPHKHPWLMRLLARRPRKVGGRGPGQQDGTHGLGAADTRRHLSRAGARGEGVKGSAREDWRRRRRTTRAAPQLRG